MEGINLKEMRYTYDSYRELINLLKSTGYKFVKYSNSDYDGKNVIMRHDIDIMVQKAVEMAKVEQEEGISSTYYVLLSSDLYNVCSREDGEGIREIIKMGHDVGLHFDETRYNCANKDMEEVIKRITKEAEILSDCIEYNITSVSMHIPSKEVLEADLCIPNIINSYSKRFFSEFKYLSDSERRWREPVLDIIESQTYDKLHILTHPFWYNDTEISKEQTVNTFINANNKQCMRKMSPIVPGMFLEV